MTRDQAMRSSKDCWGSRVTDTEATPIDAEERTRLTYRTPV